MAFNLTGVDADLYFKATVAVNVSLFIILVLPSLLLCVLCCVALAFAEEINKKIRLFLVNLFVAETCKWIVYTLFYLTWPARLLYQNSTLCHLLYSIFSVDTTQSFVSAALYAISVYVFIKCGEDKLKWRIAVPPVVTSWMVTLAIAAVPYFDDRVTITNGFCSADPKTIFYKVYFAIIVVLVLVFLGIQIVCTILTIVYIKKNTLEGNTAVKKAIAKVLAYFIVSSVLSLFNNIAPAFIPLIRNAFPNDAITMIAVNYVLILAFNIPATATPIVTIALLKPVRVAIKAMIKKACMCCRTQPVNN